MIRSFFIAGLCGLWATCCFTGLALSSAVDGATDGSNIETPSGQYGRYIPVAKVKIPELKIYGVAEKFRAQTVSFSGYEPGTIVIDPRNYFLYYVESGGKARRYGIAVGRIGLEFRGTAVVRYKRPWPRWIPTREMIERNPQHYARYADGMDGGPGNPLGARALYLFQGNRDTYIRIHGTVQPWTIGTPVSNGCFRMTNDDVLDLYDRVQTGAKVVVR